MYDPASFEKGLSIKVRATTKDSNKRNVPVCGINDVKVTDAVRDLHGVRVTCR